MLGRLELDDFSPDAAAAALWTRDVLTENARAYLEPLEPKASAQGVDLFHGSPRDPIWEYVLSGLTAELCLDTTDYRVSFIGHSHVALSFNRNEGESATGSTRRATIRRPGRWPAATRSARACWPTWISPGGRAAP